MNLLLLFSFQVQFLDADAPKLLLLDNLSWDDNELSRHFQSCKDPQGFMRVWDEQISPFLDNSTGRFQRTGEQEKNSHQNVSKVTTPSTSGKKRARTPKSPPTLVPASKYAHLEDNSDDSEFEEGDMDEKITQYFLGK